MAPIPSLHQVVVELKELKPEDVTKFNIDSLVTEPPIPESTAEYDESMDYSDELFRARAHSEGHKTLMYGPDERPKSNSYGMVYFTTEGAFREATSWPIDKLKNSNQVNILNPPYYYSSITTEQMPLRESLGNSGKSPDNREPNTQLSGLIEAAATPATWFHQRKSYGEQIQLSNRETMVIARGLYSMVLPI